MWSRVLILAAAAAAAAAPAAAQAVDFARDVLPLLSDRCFGCHGPDEAARRAGLRLDRRPASAGVLDELLRRIEAADSDRMPPADSGLTLAADEVATLRRWIAQGAPWAPHWAFVPPAQVTPPAVDDAAWCRNDVDRFVWARLAAAGLRPAPPADPATLLRRVSLDLTGLPPEPDAVAAFASDPGEAGWQRAVDRLLASPRYGERMAWPWLRAARYADTDGYQADPTRQMWPWRDWLIDALNDNVPFDRLTIELIAGDLLPDATPEQVLASAFHRNHAYNGEGGRIAEETRVENVFDRAETTATVWLGLTLQCARCHDHKYDPITQREYYGLYAFFDQTSESGGPGNGRAAPTLRYLDPAQRARLAAIDADRAALQAAMNAPDAAVDAGQQAWVAEQHAALRAGGVDPAPVVLSPWRVRGPEPVADDPVALAAVTDGWRDADYGDGAVHALPEELGATYLQRRVTAASARQLELSLGSDDGLRVWCNGELLLARDVRRSAAPDQDRVTASLRAGRNELLLEIVNTGGRGGFYFALQHERIAGLPAAVVRALLVPGGDRSAGDAALLRRHYREQHSTAYRRQAAAQERLAREAEQLREAAPEVMVMDRLPADRRRTTRVLERGGYDQPREAVTPGVPAFLPPLRCAAPDRLALARWLVAPEHPLTARVAVDRAWRTLFGRGLVATPEDFGRQGSAPSHPRLLDWLARWYVASGWDTKALHRLIVTSATYRQSAAADPAAFRADPDNVLLARGPRFRMPSWMLRDQALQLGGLLVEHSGGPPVRPYQPEGVWAEATFGKIRYERDAGDALHRRSVYVFWRRIVGPTMLFDEPARQTCVVGVTRTNTPLHALVTCNDTGYVEAARGLAQRAWRAAADPAARVAWAFAAATARAPDPEELTLLLTRFERARARFVADQAGAAALLAVGESPRDASIPAADHAAMTIVASILLNLDEVVTRP